MEPVTTGEIYWGAMPFVIIQLVMVATVLTLPSVVMHSKVRPALPPSALPAAMLDTQYSGPALGERLVLPPYPPEIEGAPKPDATGPGAPQIDLDQLPNFEAPTQ
jgi:hypothetical protein